MDEKPKDLDIKDVLANIDKRNLDFYASLTEEQKKKFVPVVYIRWMSAVGEEKVDFEEARRQGRKKGDGKGKWPSSVMDNGYTEYHLMMVNEAVNRNIFALYHHPELLWKLLAVTGAGTIQNHIWLKNSEKDKPYAAVTEIFRKKFPMANSAEIKMLKNITDIDEFTDLVYAMGLQDEETKKLIKEFKDMKKDG